VIYSNILLSITLHSNSNMAKTQANQHQGRNGVQRQLKRPWLNSH